MSAAEVLERAADLLVEHGWVPSRTLRSTDHRLTALQAITLAVDELTGSRGVVTLATDDKGRSVYDSADLLADALDAVTLELFGRSCGAGPGVSVSGWERRSHQTADGVVLTLRDVAQTARRGGLGAYVGAADAADGRNTPTTAPDIDTTTTEGQRQLATELKRRGLRLQREGATYHVQKISYASRTDCETPLRHWADAATLADLAAVAEWLEEQPT